MLTDPSILSLMFLSLFRLLKGLGAPRNIRIYWAGGEPFGGVKALQPLESQYPNLFNKWDLANPQELDGIKDKPSIMAALDYIVCLRSRVFLASHGGNMARSLQVGLVSQWCLMLNITAINISF